MEQVENKLKYINSFISGGVAGITAKTVVAPLERIKILFQTTTRRFTYKDGVSEALSIYKHEGMRGLWRGNFATVLQMFPFAAIQFATFDVLQAALSDPQSSRAQKNFYNFIAGSVAGICATISTYPTELVRTRMAMQKGKAVQTNLRDTTKSIFSKEGPKGFYRGMFPSFIGIIPYKGSGFLMFYWLKDKTKEHYPGLAQAQMFDFIFGAIAGLFSQLVSYPFDTLRKKMQAESVLLARGDIIKRKCIIGWSKYIMRHEGLNGLFKGCTVNMFKGPIANGVAFTAKNFLHRRMDGAYAF